MKNVFLKRRKHDGAVTLFMFFIRFPFETHQSLSKAINQNMMIWFIMCLVVLEHAASPIA